MMLGLSAADIETLRAKTTQKRKVFIFKSNLFTRTQFFPSFSAIFFSSSIISVCPSRLAKNKDVMLPSRFFAFTSAPFESNSFNFSVFPFLAAS